MRDTLSARPFGNLDRRLRRHQRRNALLVTTRSAAPGGGSTPSKLKKTAKLREILPDEGQDRVAHPLAHAGGFRILRRQTDSPGIAGPAEGLYEVAPIVAAVGMRRPPHMVERLLLRAVAALPVSVLEIDQTRDVRLRDVEGHVDRLAGQRAMRHVEHETDPRRIKSADGSHRRDGAGEIARMVLDADRDGVPLKMRQRRVEMPAQRVDEAEYPRPISIRAIVRISPIPASPQAAIVRSSTSPATLSMTIPARRSPVRVEKPRGDVGARLDLKAWSDGKLHPVNSELRKLVSDHGKRLLPSLGEDRDARTCMRTRSSTSSRT